MNYNRFFSYYLFSLSNFIAAFGGGMILGKGLHVISLKYLQGGSILAFFVGSLLGLILLQFIPDRTSKSLARWFSIYGAITSLCLIVVFEKNAIDGKLYNTMASVFFILLSIRFAFWFYSRVLRASIVAGQEQRIAWVELGYYIGIILGLIIWKCFNITISLIMALTIDCLLQFFAGLFDLATNRFSVPIKNNEINALNSNILEKKSNLYWRLSASVVFFTIGIQAVIFELAHHASSSSSTAILAVFYLGVAISALIYKKFKVKLSWSVNTDYLRKTSIILEQNNHQKKIKIITLTLLAAFFGSIAILQIYSAGSLLLISIGLSALFYELVALAILDRIGVEQRYNKAKNMIVRTYGLMGVGSAITLWIMGAFGFNLLGLITVLIICSIASILSLWHIKRIYVSDFISV